MAQRVLVTHPVVEGSLSLLEEHYEVTVADGLERPEDLIPALQGATALLPLLTVTVDEALLEAAPGLKVVANHAVGYDNIDLGAATRRGIAVTNTPGVLTEATADFTWALILGITRRLGEGERLVRAGRFDGWSPTLLLGLELRGATLGVVGLGQIGRAVAKRAAGFGMELLHHDPSADETVELGGRTSRGVPLEELLARADVVTLHVPLSEGTHHLIDARRLGLMRKGAYLVNSSRGPVVDEAALVAHLRAGSIAGAALDVYEDEPALCPGLAGLDNVLLQPHLGSATHKTRFAMAATAAKNIHAALQGQRPPNLLNPEVYQ